MHAVITLTGTAAALAEALADLRRHIDVVEVRLDAVLRDGTLLDGLDERVRTVQVCESWAIIDPSGALVPIESPARSHDEGQDGRIVRVTEHRRVVELRSFEKNQTEAGARPGT
jgi:hypothetical protein